MIKIKILINLHRISKNKYKIFIYILFYQIIVYNLLMWKLKILSFLVKIINLFLEIVIMIIRI
jgi:hypothetical protein